MVDWYLVDYLLKIFNYLIDLCLVVIKLQFHMIKLNNMKSHDFFLITSLKHGNSFSQENSCRYKDSFVYYQLPFEKARNSGFFKVSNGGKWFKNLRFLTNANECWVSLLYEIMKSRLINWLTSYITNVNWLLHHISNTFDRLKIQTVGWPV